MLAFRAEHVPNLGIRTLADAKAELSASEVNVVLEAQRDGNVVTAFGWDEVSALIGRDDYLSGA